MNRTQRRILAGRSRVPMAVENRYARALRGVMAAVHKEYVREIEPLLKARHDAAEHVPKGYFDALGVRIQTAVRVPVAKAFSAMAGSVERVHAIDPRKDPRISAQINAARDANIRLVENAGRVYADQVRAVIEDPDNFGLRVEEIQEKIMARGDVSESRAELIARDQTLKLNGQVNQLKQTGAGVTQYTWSTSHDERVRESHAELDGEVFDWSSPPEPGHPGEDFQCRCIALAYFDDE